MPYGGKELFFLILFFLFSFYKWFTLCVKNKAEEESKKYEDQGKELSVPIIPIPGIMLKIGWTFFFLFSLFCLSIAVLNMCFGKI